MIMKKIIMNIKKAFENFGKHYLEAMTWYGDAINNSRGLVGA